MLRSRERSRRLGVTLKHVADWGSNGKPGFDFLFPQWFSIAFGKQNAQRNCKLGVVGFPGKAFGNLVSIGTGTQLNSKTTAREPGKLCRRKAAPHFFQKTGSGSRGESIGRCSLKASAGCFPQAANVYRFAGEELMEARSQRSSNRMGQSGHVFLVASPRTWLP